MRMGNGRRYVMKASTLFSRVCDNKKNKLKEKIIERLYTACLYRWVMFCVGVEKSINSLETPLKPLHRKNLFQGFCI